MKRDGLIVPVKSYAPRQPRPKVTELPDRDAQIGALKSELRRVKDELALAKDRIRRYREVVQSEIEYWERGLKHGEWDGIEATKRRLSRLRGAVEYVGVAGFGVDEKIG